jgi:FtsP/CotA-like multicopper oxidase with cupredoxin domain
MLRRDFVRVTGATAAGAWLGPAVCGLTPDAVAAPRAGAADVVGLAGDMRLPLPRPRLVDPSGLTLTAAETTVAVGERVAPAWAFNGSVPGPALQAHRGERVRVDLRNALREPTIVHWHGLHVPEAADGHPRLAVPPGASYAYDFAVEQRAALHWYHPHAHARTAAQVYQGLAGLFVVRDEEEAALHLPGGEREVFLVLQDRRAAADAAAAFAYRPAGPDMMAGLLGETAFGNGVPWPTLDVEASTHRVRVLNASNARIYRLALGTGAPLVVVGNDGGLLPSPARVASVDLGPGERVDLLVDLAGLAVGTRVLLRSLAFTLPGGMGGMGRGMGGRGGMGRGMGGAMGGGAAQGDAMDVLELVVVRPGGPAFVPPARLSAPPALADGRVEGERTFRFASRMMRHTIDGREFDMSRVDERVPLGRLERWTFVNDDMLPHPVHVHATQFEVAARRGGRGAVLPWERGRKDTVLVLPGESVDVLARFDRHRGLFLLHCHNLEHEDAGMMLNFEVA